MKGVPSHSNSGFTLLEVLIAVIILSIGLLGFARAEIIALHNNQTAYLQSLAELQTNSLAERLRICGAKNTSCLTQQITTWKNENNKLFPHAQSNVIVNNSDYVITITWQPVPTNNKPLTAATAILQVRL